MQVILKKDIPQLGRIGDLVRVREGYARNFLIPRAYAAAANPANLKNLEHQKRLVEVHKKKVQKDSQELAKLLEGVQIKIQRRFNEAGKMYGTLTGADIASELKKKDFHIDRRDADVEGIKTPGEHPVKVRLAGDVYASVTLVLEALQEKSSKEEGKKAKAKTPRAKKAKAEAPAAEEAPVEKPEA
jgi:large subunit ribosomal protein L9